MTRFAPRLIALAAVVAIVATLTPGASLATPAGHAARVSRKADPAPDSVIVQLGSGTATPTASAVRALAASLPASAGVTPASHGTALVRVGRGETAESLARALAKRPGVRWAAPNIRMHALALAVPPNDTFYTNPVPGGLAQRDYLGPLGTAANGIDLEPAWQLAFAAPDHGIDPSRPGVTVALVDTGYSSSSSENTGLFVPVHNYIANNANTADDEGHGTQVGMIMHAKTGNGFGIAGVLAAATSKVLVFKVMDSTGNGSMSDALAGVKSATDHGARVINCSFGGSGLDRFGQLDPGIEQAWDDAVAYANARGAVVVAASGNDGTNDINYPAAALGAIAVGAVDPSTGLRSSFSDFGPHLALVAPGEDILSFSKDPGSVTSGAGTSFSAPMVTASIALLWSLLPKASSATITSAVLTTCRDLGAAGRDDLYGRGELDVWAAYRKLMTQFPTQPPVSVTPKPGFLTRLTWTRAAGSDVIYRYGVAGGSTQTTTGTSAQAWLGKDGTYTAFVAASAGDMFSSAPATVTFTVATGKPQLTYQRFSGADRYATAVAVSRAEYPSGAAAVVLVSGENYPDALTASVLAYRSHAPLLLTHAASLPGVTASEIARLNPSSVIIVGGAAAVSAGIRTAVAAIVPSVARIAGSDRYGTAEQVALAVKKLEGGSIPSGTVVVASGENFPDAASASPMAAAAGFPILLTRASSLPAITATALAEVHATHTILLGGTPAVSVAAASRLPAVSRVSGNDRYATSRAIADYAVGRGILTRADLGMATGRTFPDALAGGVLMAGRAGPMLLVDGETTDLDSWLTSAGPSVSRLDVLGAEGVVPLPLTYAMLGQLRK